MPYTYDDQLIDAVAVRRRRLSLALLFGRQRLRRTWSDRVSTFMISAILAVLACAACVAISFVTHLLSSDPALQRNRPGAPGGNSPTAAVSTVLPSPGTSPGGSSTSPVHGAKNPSSAASGARR